MHVPSTFHHHHHQHRGDYKEEREEVEATYRSDRGYIRSKSLPLSTLIEIQKQKTDKEDIDIGKLRTALYDIFGEDASPKVKKIMKLILSKLQKRIVHEISNEG